MKKTTKVKMMKDFNKQIQQMEPKDKKLLTHVVLLQKRKSSAVVPTGPENPGETCVCFLNSNMHPPPSRAHIQTDIKLSVAVMSADVCTCSVWLLCERSVFCSVLCGTAGLDGVGVGVGLLVQCLPSKKTLVRFLLQKSLV